MREKLRSSSRSSEACSMTLSITSQGSMRDITGMASEYQDYEGDWIARRSIQGGGGGRVMFDAPGSLYRPQCSGICGKGEASGHLRYRDDHTNGSCE